jgi:EF-P beta-lysylation protein EpmB
METRHDTNYRFIMHPSWQSEVTHAFRNIEDLLRFLELDLQPFEVRKTVFPFLVTRSFAERMTKGDPLDPLLLQVLPRPDELLNQEGFTQDPVSDLNAVLAPGLLQKYRHRALVITTGACAIHCRYCFRRDFPYQEQQGTRSRWQSHLGKLREDKSLEEVILSGGDPLMLSNERLAEMFRDLTAIPHLERIRIHTRIPVVLPERIDAALLDTLRTSPIPVVMVIHSNHPNELSEDVHRTLTQIQQTGATLLNQAVLLRGINDQAGTLTALSKKLLAMNVIPYYLHVLDRVTGTGHFEVSESEASLLLETIRKTLPGYLVPKLVREIAGEPSKTPLA